MKHLCAILLALVGTWIPAHAGVYLTLLNSNKNHVNYTYDGNTGTYDITTTGGDPYMYTSALSRSLTEDETHLIFEYKCSRTIANFQLYFGNTWSEQRSRIVGNLTSTGNEWREMDINLSIPRSSFNWGSKGQQLRFDFGFNSGYNIQIRNISINAKDDPAEKYKRNLSKNLEKYLSTTDGNECGIELVSATKTQITINGHARGNGQYSLVEVAPYQDVTELTEFLFEQPIEEADFSITVSRTALRSNFRFDRLLSKWAIIDRSSGSPVLACHARNVDEIPALRQATEMPLKGKKGLGGFWLGPNVGDIDALGIKSVTINVLLTAMISTSSTSFSSSITYTYAGKTYYLDAGQVNSLDATLRECTRRGIVTSVILLISPNACPAVMKKIMIHPECDGGNYSMANMTTIESVCAYAAVIQYMALRYSGTQYGRINHWILHNEVDYGKEWTNMGDQPVHNYMDAYYKSMRLVSTIARQYDQHTWVMGSYTHSWTNSSSDGAGYNTKNMLEITKQYSRTEGDFPWGVAYHPYPQDLTKPRFWVNDTQSTYDMNSQFCTFKNLEVIDAWARDADNFYQGREKRLIFLSENGTNSPDYSDTQLAYQAAGACWAWKKTARLTGIDGIQWHNWQDNRAEYGLRIGLRRYIDDETEPNGCKPAWYVWQAAETDNEDEVFQPYLKIIGRSNWESIFDEKLMDVEELTDANTQDGEPHTRVYTTDGRLIGYRLDILPRGIYILRQGGHSRKVMR
ncbi:MAG: hypothetical protein K5945_11345 [Bacteroidaceae bacterium]|nr:hypothetical protein [Bacteroidaceae bacterium]